MRKIILALLISAVILIGCVKAAAPVPTPATATSPNPFVGEWGGIIGANLMATYVFTEDQFTIKDPEGQILSGSYSFTHNRITFDMDDSSWTQSYEGRSWIGITLAALT